MNNEGNSILIDYLSTLFGALFVNLQRKVPFSKLSLKKVFGFYSNDEKGEAIDVRQGLV